MSARVVALETEAERRERRIRELESRLALADAEVRDLRDEVARRTESAEPARPVVRIGESARTERVAEPIDEVPEPEDDGPRPVLRLYGPPSYSPPVGAEAIRAVPAAADFFASGAHASAGFAALQPSLSVASGSAGVLGSLPVVGPPGSRSSVPAIPDRPVLPPASASSAPTAAVGPSAEALAVREYQLALGHVAARRFDEALSALAAFLARHPQHPYADNAMYWRGEILYARRDYASAERELLEMLRRFPRGNKVPDALFRLGLCRQRQGDIDGARAIFRRLRAEHPGSVAARLASREET